MNDNNYLAAQLSHDRLEHNFVPRFMRPQFPRVAGAIDDLSSHPECDAGLDRLAADLAELPTVEIGGDETE